MKLLKISRVERLLKNVSESPNKNLEVLRRSEKEKKKPYQYWVSPVNTNMNYFYVNIFNANNPITYKEAITCDENDLWIEAMNKEINWLIKNKT